MRKNSAAAVSITDFKKCLNYNFLHLKKVIKYYKSCVILKFLVEWCEKTMHDEGSNSCDGFFIRFVPRFDFFPSTSEGRSVRAVASEKDREVEVVRRGMRGRERKISLREKEPERERVRERERERERDRDSHLVSERYLHVICILVDPYCFHFNPFTGVTYPRQLRYPTSLSVSIFSLSFCLVLSYSLLYLGSSRPPFPLFAFSLSFALHSAFFQCFCKHSCFYIFIITS